MSEELEPKLLNVVNLAGDLGKLMDLVNKLSDPATLAKLQADAKAAADAVAKVLADAQAAEAQVNQVMSDVRTALGI